MPINVELVERLRRGDWRPGGYRCIKKAEMLSYWRYKKLIKDGDCLVSELELVAGKLGVPVTALLK